MFIFGEAQIFAMEQNMIIIEIVICEVKRPDVKSNVVAVIS